MRALLRVLRWLLNAAVFFTLFAFALNNQHAASVHFFFGHNTQQPMALIVLVSFSVGLFVGVLGMLGTLWRKPKARQGVPETALQSLDPAPELRADPHPASPHHVV